MELTRGRSGWSRKASLPMLVAGWALMLFSLPLPAIDPDEHGWGESSHVFDMKGLLLSSAIGLLVPALLLSSDFAATLAAVLVACVLYGRAAFDPAPAARGFDGGAAAQRFAWARWGLLLVWLPPLFDVLRGSGNNYYRGYYVFAAAAAMVFVASALARPKANAPELRTAV